MRMRAVRSLVVACICVVGCLVILSTLTNTTPASPTALHTLVTHTHNHLNHLQNNIKEEFESLVSSPDPEVLHKLGFVDEPLFYPHTNWTNLTTPVIATAVWSGNVEEVSGVVAMAAQLCSGSTLLVYTLDLSRYQLARVESVCNDTCSVVVFDPSQYPSHVRNWRLKAYRPIIIQELLVRAGAVLWLDPTIRLISNVTTNTSASADHITDSGGEYFIASPDNNSDTVSSGDDRSHLQKADNDRSMSQRNIVNTLMEPTNGTGMQALYPADQASLLNLENRYVTLKETSSQNVNDRDGSQSFKYVVTPEKRSKRSYGRSFTHEISQQVNSNENSLITNGRQTISFDRVKRNLDVEDLLGDESIIEDESSLLNSDKKQTKLLYAGDLFANGFIPQAKHFEIEDTQAESIAKLKGVKESIEGELLPAAGIELDLKSPFATRPDLSDFSKLDDPLNEADEGCLLGQWRGLAGAHRGVVAWQMTDQLVGHLPTAALTHPGMFAAMQTKKHLYDFHQMSEAGAVLLYNTEAVHRDLMKPWLSCSLSHHCVQPIGAQDTGCRYDKKPLFRYSGCHLYDTSAFNVALGLMFGPHNHSYQPSTTVVFTRSSSSSSTNLPQQYDLTATRHQHRHRGFKSSQEGFVQQHSPTVVASVDKRLQEDLVATQLTKSIASTRLSAADGNGSQRRHWDRETDRSSSVVLIPPSSKQISSKQHVI